MSAYRAPLPTCTAAALALALAACGGSSTKPPTPTPTPEPEPMEIALPAGAMLGDDDTFKVASGRSRTHGNLTYTCPPGGMDCTVEVKNNMATTAGGTATAEITPPTVGHLYTAAGEAETDARAARMAADAALKAVEADRMGLGVLKVQGDSRKARMRAQAVLDANDTLTEAVADAEEALAKAEKAKVDAMAHHEDNAGLRDAIDDAIAEAEAQVRAATAVRDDARLKAATDAVTGGPNADPQRDAAAYADEEVARRLYASMQPFISLNVGESNRALHWGWYGARVKKHYAVPTGPRTSHTRGEGLRNTVRYSNLTPGEVVKYHNAEGETFEELDGVGPVVDTRVGTANRNESKAARGLRLPVGDTVLGLKTSLTPTQRANLTNTHGNGYQTPGNDDVLYMGIPGRALCTGICTVAGSGTARRTFSGAWIFIPEEPETRWVPRDGGGYEKEEVYARYGYWLSTETDGDVWINVYHTGSGSLTPDNTLTTLSGEATYAGHAAGMAARRVMEGDGFRHHSGAFEADIRLTMRFGGTPTVEGIIDDFRAREGGNPDAVNTDWSLELTRGSYHAPSKLFVGTTPQPPDSLRKGQWQVEARGKAGEVPPLVNGDFAGRFADGRAEGVFGARKTEE